MPDVRVRTVISKRLDARSSWSTTAPRFPVAYNIMRLTGLQIISSTHSDQGNLFVGLVRHCLDSDEQKRIKVRSQQVEILR